jgi:DNA-binding CsgD family transcriptional regulator
VVAGRLRKPAPHLAQGAYPDTDQDGRRRAQAIPGPRLRGDHDLLPRVRVRSRSGRWISLYASRAESSDGRPGGTVVVIESASPEDVAWLNVASYGLTAREEEVVRFVARGRTTREISAEIFVSEHTVQRHIQNAFEKVGVRNRGELVKRLFFENLLPGMLGG